MDNETKEIKISSNQEKVEDLLLKFGKNSVELRGKGYYNPQSNTYGVLIYSEENSNELIDLFIIDSP